MADDMAREFTHPRRQSGIEITFAADFAGASKKLALLTGKTRPGMLELVSRFNGLPLLPADNSPLVRTSFPGFPMANRNGMLAGAFFLVAIVVSTTASADSLYSRLGGTPVVAAIVADAIDKTNLPLAREQLTERICTLTGGGCSDGGKMNLSHAAQPISSAEFSSLVEAMRESMRARDVPLAARNQLLEILAPKSRDAVTI